MNLDGVLSKIDGALQDYSMPRRAKGALSKVKEEITTGDQDLAVRITSAIYSLDEIVNDVNISMHAKTTLWDIIGDLEALKEE